MMFIMGVAALVCAIYELFPNGTVMYYHDTMEAMRGNDTDNLCQSGQSLLILMNLS